MLWGWGSLWTQQVQSGSLSLFPLGISSSRVFGPLGSGLEMGGPSVGVVWWSHPFLLDLEVGSKHPHWFFYVFLFGRCGSLALILAGYCQSCLVWMVFALNLLLDSGWLGFFGIRITDGV